MRKIIKISEILFLISFLFFYKFTFGQTDNEFWFAVPSVTNQHVNNYPVHLVIASFDQSSRVTVSVPANSLVRDTVFTIAKNSVQVLDLTSIKPNIEDLIPDSILNKGIHITGSNPITAYYDLGPNTNNREIFALKGANALGKEFYIPSQTLWANGYNASSGFDIVAPEDGTIVNITPTSDCMDQTGTIVHIAGIPFKVILNKGQTFNVRNVTQAAGIHFGGTHITSNKPIAVTVIDDSITISGCKDVIGDQIVPINEIGNEYIIVRGAMTTSNAESIFICTTQDSTTITLNSTIVATLNKGQIFPYTLAGAAGANFYLISSKPVYVYQVTGETGCESGYALLPSIRCTGSRDVAFSRSSPENFEIILITKNEYKGGFILNINGVSTSIDSTGFIAVPGATDFVSARIPYTTAQIPVNIGCIITNTKGLFHMGLNNGGAGSGGEYGYFSDFAKDTIFIKNTHYSGCKIVLDAGIGLTYKWFAKPFYKQFNNSDTTQYYIVKNPDTTKATTDTITVRTTTNGCTTSKNMIVNFVFPKEIIPSALCHGQNATISVPLDKYYTKFIWWDNDSINKTKIVDSTAIYTLKLYDGSCPPAISYYNVVIAPLPIINLGSYPTFCLGDGDVNLNAGTQTGNKIIWYKNNILLPDTLWTYIVKDPGEASSIADSAYYKAVVTNVCKDSASSNVMIKYEFCEITIPNVFTPNNDGVNDFFKIKNVKYLNLEVMIYNRWGFKVFEQKNYTDENSWTGKGCSEGVYYYVVKYKDIVKTGYVQLIR